MMRDQIFRDDLVKNSSAKAQKSDLIFEDLK